MISVAMTTYNGEKYITEQINSILNQSYKDIELIICDDCSTDKTYELISQFSKADNRVKVFKNKKNLGFKKNFEQAISLCKGEYIALSDQDDIWNLDKLEKSLYSIGDKDLLCTNALIIDENSNSQNFTMMQSVPYSYVPEDKAKQFKHLIHTNFVQGATILAKADFLKKCYPIPDFFDFHDWWFAIKASTTTGIAYIKDTTLKYRQHSTQVTSNTKKSALKEILDLNYIDPLKAYKDGSTLCSNLLRTLPFDKEYEDYLIYSKQYFDKMQDKDLFTLKYFIQNYDNIFWEKNPFQKIFKISKRILGLEKHRLKKKAGKK